MKRRSVGRSAALTVRMATALALLVATYCGIAAVVVALFLVFPGASVYWVVAAIAVGAALLMHYRAAGSSLLTAVRARAVAPGSEPAIENSVRRLASLADVPEPKLAIAETRAPNAFAVGLSQRGATVVVTRGLVEMLTPPELGAVLGHEISHLANRDAAVMTAVAVPRTLGEVVVGGAGTSMLGLVWYLVWPLGILPYLIGAGLTLTVSRCREFVADRGSAMLTGAPEQLMSALQKLAGHAAEIPHEDLRAANAFCIVSTEAVRVSLFADHPPVEKRLAALAEIAHELGRPV